MAVDAVLDFSFWRNASARRKRIYSFIAVFVLATVMTVLGTFVTVSAEEARQISESLNQTIASNRDVGSLATAIFLNNYWICLAMFIPIIGPIFGFFVLFSTGIAIGAVASVQGFPAHLVIFLLILTPIFWFEYISYSVGITESVWLTRRLWQRRWRELKTTALAIGFITLLLAVGAVVEAWLLIAATA